MNKQVAIIIPTLNERKNIVEIIRAFKAVHTRMEVVVADSSTDGTDEVVKAVFVNDQSVHILKCGRRGRGGAVKQGYEWLKTHSQAELVATADADGSHEPKELASLLQKSEEADLVVGSRYLRGSRIVGWPWYRHLFSRAANMWARLVLKAGIKDYTNGYRVFRRRLLEQMNLEQLDADGYIMLSQEIYQVKRLGGKITEVPTTFVNRQRGKSNFRLGLIVESGIVMGRLWGTMLKAKRTVRRENQNDKTQMSKR